MSEINGIKVKLPSLNTALQILQIVALVGGGGFALGKISQWKSDFEERLSPMPAQVVAIDTRTKVMEAEQRAISDRLDRVEDKIDAGR